MTIELPNASDEAVGVFATNLTVATDLTITTPDCENKVNGIVCASDLMVVSKATVNVNSGAATKYSSAIRVPGRRNYTQSFYEFRYYRNLQGTHG